jgi:hypothetical protein
LLEENKSESNLNKSTCEGGQGGSSPLLLPIFLSSLRLERVELLPAPALERKKEEEKRRRR